MGGRALAWVIALVVVVAGAGLLIGFGWDREHGSAQTAAPASPLAGASAVLPTPTRTPVSDPTSGASTSPAAPTGRPASPPETAAAPTPAAPSTAPPTAAPPAPASETPASSPPPPTPPSPASESPASSPPPQPAPTPAPASTPVPTPPPPPPVVEVEGFRSAHFGMTEAQVRAAAEKDFKIKPAEIKVAENLVEKTRVLVAVIPDLLPGGKAAQISYVLGYKSKKLIQVGLLWSKAIDPTVTPQRLIAYAQLLQAYFRGAGYRADSIALNAAFAKGVVAFRGRDKNNHATVLILEGKIAKNAAGTPVLTEAQQLSLFYSADPEHPDAATVARPR